jgi:hypothetical protein
MMIRKGKVGITGPTNYGYSSNSAAVAGPSGQTLVLCQGDFLLIVIEAHVYFLTLTYRERRRKESVKRGIEVMTCTLLNLIFV